MASVRKKQASSRRSVSNMSLSQPPSNASSVALVQTKTSVVRHLFSTSSGSSSSFNEYSHSETFDILPKTDYTYARSGSYSPRHLRKAYVNPNMSRRRLHGGVTPPVSMLEDSDSDQDMDNSTNVGADIVDRNLRAASAIGISDNSVYHQTGLHSEVGDISSDEADAEEINWNSQLDAKHDSNKKNRLLQSSQKARGQDYVDLEGMILRSGNHLKSIGHFFSSSTGIANRRNSTSTLNSTTINTLVTTQETHGSSSAINVYEQQQRHKRIVTGTPSSSFVSNVDYKEADFNNSALSARKNVKSAKRKNLSPSREDHEHKYVADEHQREKRDYRIQHMYGLDNDGELSESDSGMSSDLPNNYTYREQWTHFLSLATVMYSLFGGGAMAKMRPMITIGNLVGIPFLRFSRGSRGMWRLLTSMASFFVVLDAWIVTVRRWKGVLLLLPVLLLAPIFLMPLMRGQYISQLWSLKQYLVPRYFTEYGAQTVYKTSNTDSSSNLREEVERIVMALQLQHRRWPTREDIEMIARGILQPEMESIRISLLNIANEGNLEQYNVKVEQQDSKVRLAAVEKRLAVLHAKAKILESELKKTRSDLERSLAGEQERHTKLFGRLETSLYNAQKEIGGLQVQYAGLSAYDRKCCINDSMLVATVRHEVSAMIDEMLGKSGGEGSFAGWLNKRYVDRRDFERQLRLLTADMTERLSASMDSHRTNIVMPPGSSVLSEDAVKLIVEDALLKYSADRTGLPDYALESGGGSVISTRCTQTYYKKTAVTSILGIPLWFTSNSPRTVIQPDVHPGQCWAFKGQNGYLVMQLSAPIRPTGFSLEHIPRSLSPTGKIDSAPQDFTVYGLKSETDTEGTNLGNFTYSTLGKPIQYFEVQKPNPGVFSIVELRILSNHGNQEYTCLYRFRVHGVPQ